MKRYIKSSTDQIILKFEVGKIYDSMMLYGGTNWYECVRRTADTVTFKVSHISEDTGDEVDDGETTKRVELVNLYKYELDPAIDIGAPDWDKIVGLKEAIPVWEYRGETGYLFAKNY